ncbi:MAG TPA: hypothetical protein V6D08_00040 [Candidatus Obscuribacterales bacterium]
MKKSMRHVTGLSLMVALLVPSFVGCPESAAKNFPQQTTRPADTVLRVLKAVDSDTQSQIRTAEEALTRMGNSALPELKASLTGATENQQMALSSAIFRLENGFDPREAIAGHVNEVTGSASGKIAAPEQLSCVADASLRSVFPSHVFYTLKLASDATVPPPLAPVNLFAVGKDRRVELITSKGELQEWFGKTLGGAQSEERAMGIVRAWLRLAQELSYAGRFRFAVPDGAIKVYRYPAGMKASGKAVLNYPNGREGEIAATLTFDESGHLARVQEAALVEPSGAAQGARK